jgi:hypothetical protein|tara:strand:- start:50 stop:283 length:234 start_codon:yes stop_codon:yes gene_type:complete
MTEQVKEDKITIDGKDYIASDLPLEIRNTIVARQEVQNSKIRHLIEIEKVDVLTNYYNEKIKKGLEEKDGGDSKPKD